VLTTAAFNEIWKISREIEAMVVSGAEGVDSRYRDSCVKTPLDVCKADGVLRFFSSQHKVYSSNEGKSSGTTQ